MVQLVNAPRPSYFADVTVLGADIDSDSNIDSSEDSEDDVVMTERKATPSKARNSSGAQPLSARSRPQQASEPAATPVAGASSSIKPLAKPAAPLLDGLSFAFVAALSRSKLDHLERLVHTHGGVRVKIAESPSVCVVGTQVQPKLQKKLDAMLSEQVVMATAFEAWLKDKQEKIEEQVREEVSAAGLPSHNKQERPAEAEAIDEPATSAAEDGPVREQEKEEASKTNDSAVEDASEQPVVPDPEVAMDQTKDPHETSRVSALPAVPAQLPVFVDTKTSDPWVFFLQRNLPFQVRKLIKPLIRDNGGHLTDDLSVAEYRIVDPTSGTGRQMLASVKQGSDDGVRSWHWLVACVEAGGIVPRRKMKSSKPIFVSSKGEPLECWLLPELKPRHPDLATQLRLGGAILVDAKLEADVLIVDEDNGQDGALSQQIRAKLGKTSVVTLSWVERSIKADKPAVVPPPTIAATEVQPADGTRRSSATPAWTSKEERRLVLHIARLEVDSERRVGRAQGRQSHALYRDLCEPGHDEYEEWSTSHGPEGWRERYRKLKKHWMDSAINQAKRWIKDDCDFNSDKEMEGQAEANDVPSVLKQRQMDISGAKADRGQRRSSRSRGSSSNGKKRQIDALDEVEEFDELETESDRTPAARPPVKPRASSSKMTPSSISHHFHHSVPALKPPPRQPSVEPASCQPSRSPPRKSELNPSPRKASKPSPRLNPPFAASAPAPPAEDEVDLVSDVEMGDVDPSEFVPRPRKKAKHAVFSTQSPSPPRPSHSSSSRQQPPPPPTAPAPAPVAVVHAPSNDEDDESAVRASIGAQEPEDQVDFEMDEAPAPQQRGPSLLSSHVEGDSDAYSDAEMADDGAVPAPPVLLQEPGDKSHTSDLDAVDAALAPAVDSQETIEEDVQALRQETAPILLSPPAPAGVPLSEKRPVNGRVTRARSRSIHPADALQAPNPRVPVLAARRSIPLARSHVSSSVNSTAASSSSAPAPAQAQLLSPVSSISSSVFAPDPATLQAWASAFQEQHASRIPSPLIVLRIAAANAYDLPAAERALLAQFPGPAALASVPASDEWTAEEDQVIKEGTESQIEELEQRRGDAAVYARIKVLRRRAA